MVLMFHHKKSDGGINFVGWDTETKVYSVQYYANVGILNAEESKHTTLKEVKEFVRMLVRNGFREVTYLPRI